MHEAAPAAMLCLVALRCLIVDNNAGFLAAARDLLSRQGITVVGIASSGSEALRRTDELRPDVALVDIELGDESGFDVAQLLAGASPEPLPVVLISSYAENDFLDLVAASPAVGFVSKPDLSGKAISDVLGLTSDGAGPE
jgi:DNA-binding NarL/FixJ family response regulator